jgi:hypothetical protein
MLYNTTKTLTSTLAVSSAVYEFLLQDFLVRKGILATVRVAS